MPMKRVPGLRVCGSATAGQGRSSSVADAMAYGHPGQSATLPNLAAIRRTRPLVEPATK